MHYWNATQLTRKRIFRRSKMSDAGVVLDIIRRHQQNSIKKQSKYLKGSDELWKQMIKVFLRTWYNVTNRVAFKRSNASTRKTVVNFGGEHLNNFTRNFFLFVLRNFNKIL